MNEINIGRWSQWNPWVGCYKISPACKNCFIDGLNSFKFVNTPVPKVGFGDIIFVCLHSDFFLEEADPYRALVWKEIKEHPENIFLIITKRVERIKDSLPEDWGDGYENVILSVTVETQDLLSYRLNIFKNIPCKHKWITCSPLIEPLDLSGYLTEFNIECVECCGESGAFDVVRPTYYEWVEKLSKQCFAENIRFMFMKLGFNFIYKNIRRADYSTCFCSPKAAELKLDVRVPIKFNLNNKLFIMQ